VSISISPTRRPLIVYPETDGKPMAENTLQFEWIVTIKEGLDRAFHERPDVFVAGDLFWYPVEGRPDICAAPDALAVIGRPTGHRRSDKQWEEAGIAPQVVFEVLSPKNRFGEMYRKLRFYEEHGAVEYYLYDPDECVLEGWRHVGEKLEQIASMNGWTSPQLGVRFELSSGDLRNLGQDGRRFQSNQELAEDRDRLARECEQLGLERERIAQSRDVAPHRADEMAAELRALGLDPPALS
jgi:Uma2 family endonuclease